MKHYGDTWWLSLSFTAKCKFYLLASNLAFPPSAGDVPCVYSVNLETLLLAEAFILPKYCLNDGLCSGSELCYSFHSWCVLENNTGGVSRVQVWDLAWKSVVWKVSREATGHTEAALAGDLYKSNASCWSWPVSSNIILLLNFLRLPVDLIACILVNQYNCIDNKEKPIFQSNDLLFRTNPEVSISIKSMEFSQTLLYYCKRKKEKKRSVTNTFWYFNVLPNLHKWTARTMFEV